MILKSFLFPHLKSISSPINLSCVRLLWLPALLSTSENPAPFFKLCFLFAGIAFSLHWSPQRETTRTKKIYTCNARCLALPDVCFLFDHRPVTAFVKRIARRPFLCSSRLAEKKFTEFQSQTSKDSSAFQSQTTKGPTRTECCPNFC